MRRSTAAAVGTLAGAALIIGVRLSVSAPVVTAAPPAVDVANNDLGTGDPEPSASSGKKKKEPAKDDQSGTAGGGSGLTDGTFKGKAVRNPYGTVQVSIKVTDGKIAAIGATFPTTGQSATINPAAVPQLKKETLKAQSAEIDAVSGATFTSKSYVESLQAALDQAGA
ncbi:FMN-binding protein [Krasilnikovia sp. MM14-A1259]|uniref:FMN-binding protein n=1 Tax=Krasilnikovia sp. MM14-A1259 TaxID=3373539 RepID=UPI00380346F7